MVCAMAADAVGSDTDDVATTTATAISSIGRNGNANDEEVLREQAHEKDYEELKKKLRLEQDSLAVETETTNGSRSPRTFPSSSPTVSSWSMDELRTNVVKDMVGHDTTFVSPFEWKEVHPRSSRSNTSSRNDNDNDRQSKSVSKKDDLKLHVPMVYCDFTASHRPVVSIEDYLGRECAPLYGNTHTNTSVTGSQSSAFVSEARQIIAEACGAKTTGKASQDIVLFSGSGTTAAVQLLIDCLGLKYYNGGNDDDGDDDQNKPLVILGPMEHHSNLLPWREIGSHKVKIEMVRYDQKAGTLDMKHLEWILERHKARPSLKIGSFCAASNLTGTVVEDVAVTALLHRYGALSFWDYATGASYLDMNMNPSSSVLDDNIGDASLLSKDAMFFSGHKLLGGVGTPGVLIVKKRIISSINPPERCGGGTVFYVTDDHHRFLSNKVERYEGGTPDVMGIWRLGLVFKLKQSLKQKVRTALLSVCEQQDSSASNESRHSSDNVVENIPRQHATTLEELDLMRAQDIQQRLKDIPNIVLVDGRSSNAGTPKLPIFSFLVRCGPRFLHYNYVCAVLNDLFGVQSRGGCNCAGPYAQLLLGMEDTNDKVEQCLVRTKDELLRPGVSRLSLPAIGTTKEQEEYVIEAIRWVAMNGWKLLHVYRCNHKSGEWRHMSRSGSPLGIHERRWLSHYQMLDGTSSSLPNGHGSSDSDCEWSLERAMINADKMLELAMNDQSSISQTLKMVDEDEDASALRWYVYPKDVARLVRDGVDTVPGGEDGASLLGALNPLVLRTDLDLESPVDTVDHHATSKSKPSIDLPSMMHFKDGEHTGEAPLEEILEGFDNGELSHDCMVYDNITDSWKLISSLVPENDFDDGNETEPREPEPVEEIVEVFDTEPTNNDTMDINVDDELPLMEKNDRKKPQRTPEAWGTGQLYITEPVSAEDGATKRTRSKSRHVKPPPKLMRQVTQAMIQWDMLKDGDKLLLGLSGGKDSLSLLHILLEFKKKLPIKFDIEVCTVDPMTPSFDPSPLIPYVESLGLKYHFIRDEIVERAATSGKDGHTVSSLCAYCARMKRGNLYACARKNNCNKLVLAQHLDDLAESFFMSVMHNGFLRTMKANYKINAGDLSVIRPLAYCRESLMTDFAKSAHFPIINENCPACFEEPKERARVKKLLSKEETLYPQFYDNIKRALMPLMHDDATAILRSYTEEAVAKTRRDDVKRKVRQRPASTNNDETTSPNTNDSEKSEKDPERNMTLLANASEDDLVAELARRRADRFRLAGAMPSTTSSSNASSSDPTGQVCTLNGGNGTIPCNELME